ncbi:SDR family oxidoreductase [Roseibacillus persicicus]|uniref:SDR family oxidoreductase n=1 Tax=Roseibacillus persicicus TaxID=454148 RepID=UPI00398B5547
MKSSPSSPLAGILLSLLALASFALGSEEAKKAKTTVLITGANRGLGLALSKQFAAGDYHVIGTARSPGKATELKEVADEVLPLDVTSDESIQALAEALKGRTVDILVNNAGYFGPTKGLGPGREKSAQLKSLTRAEVLDCFAVNSAGPIFVTQGLLPNLLQSEHPKVVMISSRSGIINKDSASGAYGYRISKTAINRAMKIMASDKSLAKCIFVSIAPGHNQTDMGGNRPNLLDPDESMAMVKTRIEELTHQHNGRFWYYDGTELPW